MQINIYRILPQEKFRFFGMCKFCQLLNYKKNTKFLGVYITTKLNWRLHVENLINKARKRLNFLKNSEYTVLESG